MKKGAGRSRETADAHSPHAYEKVILVGQARGEEGRVDARDGDAADHGDDHEDQHDLGGADLLLGHEPPAQPHKEEGQELGHDAVKGALQAEGGVLGELQVEARGDGDPGRGDGADDHGTDHDDGAAQGGGVGTDEGLDGGAAERVALVVGELHAEVHEHVPHDHVEDRAHGVAAGGEAEGDAEQDGDEGTDDDGVAQAGERAHQAGADAVDGLGVHGLAIGAGLLEAGGQADDHGTDLRLGVEEGGVGAQRLDLVLLLLIEVVHDGHHSPEVTKGLHVLLGEAGEVTVDPALEGLLARSLGDFLKLCHD